MIHFHLCLTDEISNATRNYIQRPYQPPEREEAPAQTKPCEASEGLHNVFYLFSF